jgi:hypothetical protein
MVLSAVLLLWWGRDQVLHGDDLFYAVRLAEHSLPHAILYSNVYLIAVPMLIYKAMFELLGIGDYLPYRIVEVGLVLLCAGLFYELARRRVGYLLALAPTILLLFFGSGWDVLITGTRIPALLAVCSGLGALLLLERDEGRLNAIAAVLLAVAVTSHPTGVAFLAAGATMIAFRPGRRRWQTSWVVLAPALVFAVWIAFFRTSPYGPRPTPSDVIAFIGESWVVLTATTTGLFGVLSEPVYQQWPAKVAGAILFAAAIAAAIAGFRRLGAPFWAGLAGLFVLLASPRLSPEGLLRTPDAPRYLYPEAILFLLAFVGLAGALREAAERRGSRAFAPLAWLATLVLGLGVWANVNKLRDASEDVRVVSTTALGEFSAYEIEKSRIDPDFSPNAFFPNAGDYLAASATYGAVGRSAASLPGESLAVRSAADSTIAAALGIQLEPAAGPADSAAARRPRLERTISGSAIRRGGCIELRPAAAAPTPLALLRLPPGGARIAARDPSSTALYLGRFAPPSVGQVLPPGGGRYELRIPDDGVPVPWTLRVDAAAPVAICPA